MDDTREITRLKSILYDFEQAQEAIKEYEEFFVLDDAIPHLETALKDVTASIKQMIENRTPKYHVMGVVTANNPLIEEGRLWEGQIERSCAERPLTLDEAKERLAELEALQRQPHGLEYWLYYIKEV